MQCSVKKKRVWSENGFTQPFIGQLTNTVVPVHVTLVLDIILI